MIDRREELKELIEKRNNLAKAYHDMCNEPANTGKETNTIEQEL